MFRFSTSTSDLKPRKQDHVISDKYRTSHAYTHEILLIEEIHHSQLIETQSSSPNSCRCNVADSILIHFTKNRNVSEDELNVDLV